MRKTICLHAAQAQTGKTHIIANLAVELALRGYHVGVLDADMITPGLHQLFNLPAESIGQTLNDYVWDEEADLANCIYDVTDQLVPLSSEYAKSGTVHLLPANPSTKYITRIKREGYAINLLVDALPKLRIKYRFDILLIDTHPGFERNNLLLACSARLLLVTTTQDQHHLRNTDYLMDQLRRIHEPAMGLVLNQMTPDTPDPVEYGERYELPVAASLPATPLLNDTNDDGLLMISQPDHVWNQQIMTLADYIITPI